MLILSACLGFGTQAQDFNPAENKTVYSGDTTFVFAVKPLPERFTFAVAKDYFWYTNQKIHRNQGGAYGWFLHGKYRAFTGSNRLVEEGNFANGLKNGVWRCWNPAGDLLSAVKYRKGKMLKQLYPAAEKGKDLSRKKLRLFGKHRTNEGITPADSTTARP